MNITKLSAYLEEFLALKRTMAEADPHYDAFDRRAVAGPRSIVFIPRDTWISATNTGAQDIHVFAVFSRQGFERYMRAISVKQGQPVTPLSSDELPRLRALGHSMYWDTSKGPYPPGVAHP